MAGLYFLRNLSRHHGSLCSATTPATWQPALFPLDPVGPGLLGVTATLTFGIPLLESRKQNCSYRLEKGVHVRAPSEGMEWLSRSPSMGLWADSGCGCIPIAGRAMSLSMLCGLNIPGVVLSVKLHGLFYFILCLPLVQTS